MEGRLRQTVTQSGEGRRAVGGSPTRDVRISLHFTAVNGASSVHPTDQIWPGTPRSVHFM